MDLRDTTDPDALAWQEAADAAAAAHLAGLPGRDELARRIASRLADTRIAPAVRRGDLWFEKVVLSPTDDQPSVVVRSGPTAEPRVLLDSSTLKADGDLPVTLMLVEPSPDGRTLAYTSMVAGAEDYTLRLLDVATGEAIEQETPWNVGNIAWSADSQSLWIATREVIDGEMRCPIYHQPVGKPPVDALPAPESIRDATFVVSPDDQLVLIRTGNTESRLDWVVRDGEIQPLLHGLPGGFVGAFDQRPDGTDLVVITDHQAPRGRLVRVPVATAADQSTWTELVPESDEVLRAVAVVGEELVLGYLSEATCRLRVLDRDGSLVDEVDLPGRGSMGAYAYGASHPALPMFAVGDGEVSFVFSTFDSSWGSYRYVVAERRLEVVTPPAIRVDGLVVTTITATSSDGAQVPAHVVHRADLDPTQPQATLLYGYGGFNCAFLPAFNATWSTWVESGGVFVLAHLRGGCDFGAEWWSQGRRATKQQTFDDLYAVAEELVATGWTTTDRLVVKGESNGGLLTGAAIVQRPDLWAGVVSDVPILDLLEYHRDPLSYLIGREEYGDPLVPEEAEWLRAVSPVHHVEPASYPPLLMTAGANDPRCPVWHPRLFVHLLQEAQTGDAPLHLRVYADQGHGAAGLGDLTGKDADWLAFAASVSGLSVLDVADRA